MSDIAGATEMVLGGGHVLSAINPGTLIRGLFGRSGLWGLGKLHAYDSRHVEIFWRYIASTSWGVPPLDPNAFSVLCTYWQFRRTPGLGILPPSFAVSRYIDLLYFSRFFSLR